MGPSPAQCANEYNGTNIEYVTQSSFPSTSNEETSNFHLNGIQRWTAPRGGYYTLVFQLNFTFKIMYQMIIKKINIRFSVIAMGARGGRGSGGMGSTLGTLVRGVIELEKEQKLYFLVGQPGSDACPKVCIYCTLCK